MYAKSGELLFDKARSLYPSAEPIGAPQPRAPFVDEFFRFWIKTVPNGDDLRASKGPTLMSPGLILVKKLKALSRHIEVPHKQR